MVNLISNQVEASSTLGQKPGPLENVAAVKAFIASEGARLCATVVGEQVRAIVLTGSLSRDEATLSKDGAVWRVLGDATFLVIFNRPCSINTVDIESRVQSHLYSNSIICKVAVVTSTTAELARMKPHIYSYELKERGIVLWGDRSVLKLMAPFTPADIPVEDGWWFLCNRLIEQLETAAKIEADHDTNSDVRYRIAKLYLAMAACYLLAIGQYRPSYRERAKRLGELSATSDAPACPIPLSRFSRRVSECTLLKIEGKTSGAPDAFPMWCDAVSDAESLWEWTLHRVLGVESCSSRTALLDVLAKRQSVTARGKGWLRAIVKYPAMFCRHGIRWARLACASSPRYLVYGAAGDLFFHSHESRPLTLHQLAAIAEKMPLNGFRPGDELSWRSVAMLVADNFHGLVESTRS